MKRIEAVKIIVDSLDHQALVHATGMISRESFSVRDREENFYMIGSMGLNSSIGLGIALSQPERGVVVLDGDGSVLMNMGTLASIGELHPRNLVHIALDNESYASTGGQRTITDSISLDRIASAAGYSYVARADQAADLKAEMVRLWTQPRPAFLLVKVEPGNEHDTPRVSLTPQEIKRRFMQFLGSHG